VRFPAHIPSRRLVIAAAAQFLCTLAMFHAWIGQAIAGGPASKPAPIDLRRAIELGRVEDGQIKGFSPDGRIVAVAARGKFVSVGPVRLWDLRSGKELTSVAVDWNRLDHVCFSPDSKLIGVYDKKHGIGVWDAMTSKQVMAFRPHTVYDNYVGFWFSPDSKALIYEHYGEKFPDDKTLNVRNLGAVQDRASFTGERYLMQFGPDGKFATFTTAVTRDKRDRVLVWEWKGEKSPVLVKDYRVLVDEVAVSSDLATFATAEGAEVRVMDLATGRERLNFTDESKETHIQAIKFSANGKLLIVNAGGGTKLSWKTRSTVWDISGRRVRRVSEFVEEPEVSGDGRYLAGAHSETDVSLVETATGKALGRLTQKGDVTSSHFGTYKNMKVYPRMELSPDGRLAVVLGLFDESRRSFTRIHQLDPLKELGVLESCWQARFAPDGKSMVTMTGTGQVRLWKITPAEDGK